MGTQVPSAFWFYQLGCVKPVKKDEGQAPASYALCHCPDLFPSLQQFLNTYRAPKGTTVIETEVQLLESDDFAFKKKKEMCIS